MCVCTAELECKSFVGLFPEISRAFITIDNKLFLWNYHDGSDFLLYDELSQIILSVALMRPRRGVFVAAIPYVLVVATPVEVLLFAIKFDQDNVHQPMQLFPTQFTIPSDGVHMTSSVGTDQGRVLLAGKDGAIYELDYSNDGAAQGAGSWTSLWSSQARKKCRKLNHSAPRFRLIRSLLPAMLGGLPSPLTGADGAALPDQQVSCMVYDRTRNLVFTLSSGVASGGAARNVLQCFSLGADGWDLSLRSKNEQIAAEVRASLTNAAVPPQLWEDLAAGSGGQTAADINLVSLFPVPRHESAAVVLLAVTAHGHRVYFDFGESGIGALRVRFVRLCPPAVSPDELNRGAGALGGARSSSLRVEPGFSKATSPSLVHAAYYKDGMLLLADAGRSALGDTLVAIQRELYAGTSGVGSVGVGGGAYTNASLRSWGAPVSVGGHGVGSNKLLESIDAFDLESRIAELGEVHESAQLNLLSSALFSRHAVLAASSAGSSASPQALQGLSELATQHVTPNRHFLILTSSSLLTLSASRPLDDLRAALLALRRTNDEAPLLAMFHKYGAKETAAMCLTLVGAHFVSGDSLGAGALDQVELRGGAPGQQQQQQQQLMSIASPNKLAGGAASGASTGGVSDEAMRKLAKQAFFRVGDMHAQLVASTSMGVAAAGAGVGAGTLSCKLEAIALYMSRWLRSHWDWSLCVPASSAPAGAPAVANAPSSAFLAFRFGKEYYLQLLQPLLKLQRFLQENQRVLLRDALNAASAASVSASGASLQPSSSLSLQSGLADPGRMEVESLSNLQALLSLTIEIFHLMVLFLSYSGASGGAASALLHASPFLSAVDLQRLRDFKLIEVLTSAEGHALVSKIINTLAQVGAVSERAPAGSSTGLGLGLSPMRGKRSRDDMSAETNVFSGASSSSSASALISQLHSACPTFFGQSDLLYCNALESLSRARSAWNMEAERERHLSRAMDTLASFLHAPAFPLEEVAAKLKQLHQYEGIVSLALRRAELLERREVVRPKAVAAAQAASAFGAAAAGATDDDFYATQKKRCILVLLDTLSVLILGVGKNLSNSSSSNGTATDGASPSSSLPRLDASDSSSVPAPSSETLAGARDRVLAQLLSSGDGALHAALYRWFIDKGLLEELYSVRNDHVVRFLLSRDEYVLILKDYYLRNQRWWEAAMLLRYLALTKSDQYTLQQRVEFLTRSLACARNFQQQQQLQGSLTPMRATQRGSNAGAGFGAAAGAPAVSGADLQDTIDQLNDRAEIAKIQLDIFSQLQSMLQSVRWRKHLQKRELKKIHRCNAQALLAGCSDACDSVLLLAFLFILLVCVGVFFDWQCGPERRRPCRGVDVAAVA